MTTKRHHYLPEFYIKGFVNTKSKVHVYDKKEKKFKKKEFSPSQIFFEWHRNTLTIDGEKDDFIEKLYGSIESKISPTYNKIKSQKGSINYCVKDIFDLLILISLTYWRLPINDAHSENFVSSTPNNELFFKILNKETNEEASEDFYEKVKKRNGFIELYKLSKPILDYMSLDLKNNINNWLIYGADSDVQLHILGDNPIVFKNVPNKNILESELIFPLTQGITVYHNKGNKIKQIQPEDRVMVDIMVFLQSDRYVVGPNKEYLNCIQNLASEYNTVSKIEQLRTEIFKIFE
ncbi:DUF4238 domain-containing protein [Marinifilum fragile]|uniref:DUF4238 domain-containing protein n=1 Tax=Marinifilum fragile TaxID=570161 RepID=UPI0006D11A2E|nr:DUF4238 domain-containing protein [Marinifilum fragile]